MEFPKKRKGEEWRKKMYRTEIERIDLKKGKFI